MQSRVSDIQATDTVSDAHLPVHAAPGTLNASGEAAPPGDYSVSDEHADYFSVDTEQLYYVIHQPRTAPLANVLLAGHFASERPHAYFLWVRWARHLAKQGFRVLRFDYRGVGESTGAFEEQGFSSWLADVRAFAMLLRGQDEHTPLILHGVGIGRLSSVRVFALGLGDACLGWSPPESGRHMLYETLRLRMATDFALKPRDRRKTRDEYVQDLEAGKLVEVEGYLWSQRLWREAAEFTRLEEDPIHNAQIGNRPYHVLELRRAGELLPMASKLTAAAGPGKPVRSTADSALLNPDMSFLFDPSCAWMKDAAKAVRRVNA